MKGDFAILMSIMQRDKLNAELYKLKNLRNFAVLN